MMRLVIRLIGWFVGSYFTPDTYANEHSACAARLAAGLCADLASTIFSGRVKNGFAMVCLIACYVILLVLSRGGGTVYIMFLMIFNIN